MTTIFAAGLFGLGFQEILIIAVIAILLFGATRLPDLGRAMGKTVTSFREGIKGEEDAPEKSSGASGQPPAAKVEPEPLKAPQRLTAPTFANDNAQTPKA